MSSVLIRRPFAKQRDGSQPQRCLLRVEQLESRDLLSAFTPTQIRQAYGFDQVVVGNGVHLDGSNQTIAIVDAYDDPTVASDLATFNSTYGVVGSGQLTKVNQSGSPIGPFPSYNTGWAQEIALDVEWAHAVAPGANILLVEANSSSFSDLLAAVNTAKTYPGVVAVSMSWGSSEFRGENAYDSNFVSANGQPVTFIASSGDAGAVPTYPAVSPNVLGVGGTTLRLDANNNYSSERGWSGSGGGLSKYESQPTYQAGISKLSSTSRMSPDVAYDADPNSGVYVIFNNSTYVFGGTSVAAPQWAGLVAIADQGRGASIATPTNALDGANQVLPALYKTLTADLHDVQAGSTRYGRTTYTAGAGYDLVTGLGSPAANLLVPGLVGVPAAGSSPLSGGTGGGGGHAGSNHLAASDSGDDGDSETAVDTQLVSPSAMVLEGVAAAPGPMANASEPEISAPLADVLFTNSDLDFPAGLQSVTPQLVALSAMLGPATGQQSDSAAISRCSRSDQDDSLTDWAKFADDGSLSDEGPSPTEQQLIDLALIAGGDWMA